MTAQERDVEDVLSRVLHSETDHVEPVGDGLTKIRERLTEPWLNRQWWLLRSEFMVLGWLVVVRCESFAATVRARSAAARTTLLARAARAYDSAAGVAGNGGWLPRLAAALGGIAARLPGRGAGGQRRSPGPVISWLRPALAVAGAVVLVVAGVFALGQIREGIVSLSSGAGGTTPGSSSQGTGNGVPAGNNGGSVSGVVGASTSQGGGTGRRGAGHHSGSQVSSSPCASPAASPGAPSPSPSPPPPSPSPSQSPSPTTSPTPTGSPSPTVSGAPPSAYQGVRTTALVCSGPAPSPIASPSGQASPT
jgi:hypothetical protein